MYMSWDDPQSYEGFLAAIAITAMGFPLKLFLDHFVMEKFINEDKNARYIMGIISIPFILLIFSFFSGLGFVRWYLQPSQFDEKFDGLWQGLFTFDGEFKTIGLIFTILMVLTFLVAGSISLSYGLTHMKAFFAKMYYRLRKMSHELYQEKYVNRNILKRERQLESNVKEMENLNKQIEEHPQILSDQIDELDAEGELFKTSYKAGYEVGQSRYAKEMAKENEQREADEKEKIDNFEKNQVYPPYLQARDSLLNGINERALS